MAPIPEYAGDIFKSPEGSVLIHACNCLGVWGSGVAAAIRAKFPAAYRIYHEYCTEPDTMDHKKAIIGTVLLIKPQEEDYNRQGSGKYWIACLFTSTFYGAKKDRPGVIIEQTRQALQDLRDQITNQEQKDPSLQLSKNLYTVRINALAFNVPWASTRETLEQSGLDIAVINNLDVMRAGERKEVAESMQANGFDVEAPPPWKA